MTRSPPLHHLRVFVNIMEKKYNIQKRVYMLEKQKKARAGFECTYALLPRSHLQAFPANIKHIAGVLNPHKIQVLWK